MRIVPQNRRGLRKGPTVIMLWMVAALLLIMTLMNVVVILYKMPAISEKKNVAGIAFSRATREIMLRHQQKRGIIEHQRLMQLYTLLQARWTRRQKLSEGNQGHLMKGNLGILFPGSMSTGLLDAFQQYNATYHNSKQRNKITSCMVPEENSTACTETKYTILAVSTNPNARRLFLSILRWLHDPAVADIRIILPADASRLFEQDVIYGARLMAWHHKNTVRLVFASNLLEAIAKDAPIKTRAVAWRNGDERLTRTSPAVLTTADMTTGLNAWKEKPNAVLALAPVPVGTFNMTVPQWNGLFHDQEWLCMLANEPFRSLVWENWTTELHGMALFLAHLSKLYYYSSSSTATSSSSGDASLESVLALFGGYPSADALPKNRACR